MLVIGFDDYHQQAKALAGALRADYQEVCRHIFPDGESLIQVPIELPPHVILVRSLDQPNNKIIELLFSVSALRKHGAKRITLVAPYLCYMRQDTENRPGEAVSQQVIGKLLADNFDDVITVDPHLHRVSKLSQAIPIQNALAISAGGVIGQFLKNILKEGVLVGPDSESEQWVKEIAIEIGFLYAVATKIRSGDKQVNVHLPERDYQDQNIVIIDDMASTGRTVAHAADKLLQAGARQVDVVVTHPLFCDDAEQYIKQSRVSNIWSTDSITHSTNAIPLVGLLEKSIRAIS
jgi:ribose-phosphate pyrophosphokinase